jgi:hypothetical protein
VIRAALLLAAATALAACSGPSGRNGPHGLRPTAHPTTVIATELAFARAAQEDGQWTAFADYAANDAVMFVPEPVNAKDWLKKQKDPAKAVAWQPYQVWSSCDGSLAATRGAWQRPDGTAGYFTTVWARQKNGDYKWVMDQGDTLAEPLAAAPDMIGATVADCATRPLPISQTISVSGTGYAGASTDGTLGWQVLSQPNGFRAVQLQYWDGSTWKTAFLDRVEAPAG